MVIFPVQCCVLLHLVVCVCVSLDANLVVSSDRDIANPFRWRVVEVLLNNLQETDSESTRGKHWERELELHRRFLPGLLIHSLDLCVCVCVCVLVKVKQ